jgi:hypothetical protein
MSAFATVFRRENYHEFLQAALTNAQLTATQTHAIADQARSQAN